jgi:hypothetical protein
VYALTNGTMQARPAVKRLKKEKSDIVFLVNLVFDGCDLRVAVSGIR